MKTIEQMLAHLARADVSEFAIASGRLPCIKVSGSYQPVDDVAPSSDGIVQMLVAVGGSRYVDALGTRPTQWTTRIDGVGAVAVAAVLRDEKVQARFIVAKREDASAPRPAGPRAAPVAGGKTPSASRGKSPSVPGRKVPSVGGAKEPSMPAVLSPVRAAEARAKTDDDPTVPGRGGQRAKAAAAAAPVLELDAPSPPTPAIPDTFATPGGMRMLDLQEPEVPTRPGTVGMSIDLDLERAVAATTIGSVEPLGTVRDLVLEEDGESLAPADEASVSSAGHEGATLDEMLAEARERGASDLHVVAERPLLFRVAGELLPRGAALDAKTVETAILARVPARCRPQLDADGSCDFALTHAKLGRFRVNVTRQRSGLKACVRLVAPGIPTLASLGLPEEIGKATHHHQGLIVVTGPTGHGKTSTLAAIVDIINAGTTHHVITVEDPVEYVHPRKRAMMSQREVGAHTKSFANALKASLREDPDVIVVGELRDTETVRMALAASETGHLVLGTMNTPSAARTIDRLIDLFPPGDQQQVRMTLAGGLRLIVSQRLLPAPDGKRMVAAVELLPGSIALWALIRDNKTFQIPSLQQRGRGAGILRLDDSLADLVRAGKTRKEAALAVAENAEELDAVLSGKRQRKGA
jgi:twitching motility protein PilT